MVHQNAKFWHPDYRPFPVLTGSPWRRDGQLVAMTMQQTYCIDNAELIAG
jgi:hypothetical protein